MARPTRFANPTFTDFEILKTNDDVKKAIADTKDKLVVILFNIRYPDPNMHTLETRMKKWLHQYETNVKFYKYIVTDEPQDVKGIYEIKEVPVVYFFRDGEISGKIDDFMESDPDASDTTAPNEKSPDETKLKSKLDELCKSVKY
ncbi:hypothetical protein I4U23_028223 [Adineta vaga]|nr:hypothetical protein I4U23_028223 [Adineta vaga]